MIAVMNIPKMEVAPASAAAAAEGFPEHMGALSVGIDHGYGKVEDVREQHAKELQRDKMELQVNKASQSGGNSVFSWNLRSYKSSQMVPPHPLEVARVVVGAAAAVVPPQRLPLERWIPPPRWPNADA